MIDYLNLLTKMSNTIEITNLSKRFTVRKFPWQKSKITSALSNINLHVKKGECFCLLGPNGAGKTTLIKILSSLILADKGIVKIAGYDLETQNQIVKSKIGFLGSQERSFYWRLTGRQNLDFFARFYNLTPQLAKRRINQLADIFKVKNIINDRFSQYSSGIKQKFSIIRSLLHQPQILFMDEPTKSLDPKAARDLQQLIKYDLAAKQKKTILFTTHNIQEAEYLSDRIAILDKGIIKALGTQQELQKLTGHSCRTLYDVFSYFTKDKKGNQ